MENNEQRSFGRYGDQRREYLEKYRPAQYLSLSKNGTLEQHLAEREAASSKWILQNMKKTLRRYPCPDDAAGMARWLAEMSELFRGAEETVWWMYIFGD